MSDIEQLRQERAQNAKDVLNNRIPQRVPINASLSFFAMAEYAKVDPREAYWKPSLLEEAAAELCSYIPADSSLLGMPILTPVKYQAIGAKSIIMGSNGFMQHPNTHMMEPEEYDEFIKDPYAFVVETGVPRIYTALDYKINPARAMAAISQASQISSAASGEFFKVSANLSAKFGYAPPAGGGGGGYATMDILSDQLRSFSGMSTDIRRDPGKVQAAIDAMYPWNYFHSLPPNPETYTRDSAGFYPLHMATFMREKDFAKLWWPVFHRRLTDFASLGFRCGAFLEDNWTRFLDYVQDAPTGTSFTFEYGDPKLFKEKLGKKFVLGSGFPLRHLNTLTKDQIVNKTREWLEIMMPGGQYSFGFDKGALVLADVNIENLKAVVETVLKYGVYDNPGAPAGEMFRKEDYTHSKIQPFTSRIFRTWEEYLKEFPYTHESAKPLVMNAEKATSDFYYSLLQ